MTPEDLDRMKQTILENSKDITHHGKCWNYHYGCLAVKLITEVKHQVERIEKASVRISTVLYQDRKTGKETTLVFDVPRPLRHDAALMATASALRLDRLGRCEQGFTTTSGRFVGRASAAKIAFSVGQITEKPDVLFSEDVW